MMRVTCVVVRVWHGSEVDLVSVGVGLDYGVGLVSDWRAPVPSIIYFYRLRTFI